MTFVNSISNLFHKEIPAKFVDPELGANETAIGYPLHPTTTTLDLHGSSRLPYLLSTSTPLQAKRMPHGPPKPIAIHTRRANRPQPIDKAFHETVL